MPRADAREVLLITLGTGVGGGVVTRGEVLRGAHGFGAEIGHFQVDPDGPLCACGQRGHWEALASGTALGRARAEWAAAGAARSLLAARGVDRRHHRRAGRRRRPGGRSGRDRDRGGAHARRVAVGLVGLVNIFDPERIVVSGGLVELGDVLLGPLRAALRRAHRGRARTVPRCRSWPPSSASQAGVVGAAVLARALT